jgi:hypothetical protein
VKIFAMKSLTRKKTLGLTALAISVVYKIGEHVEMTKPLLEWLNKRMGTETIIELLLSGLLVYFILSHGEKNHVEIVPAPKLVSRATLNDLDEETIESLMEGWSDAKRAGTQAGILWRFGADARSLVDALERTWQHWNDAGEHLVHPLDVRIDRPDHSNKAFDDLVTERRDFMVLYAYHLSHLRAEFPGFSSDIAQGEYPSDREYIEILRGLRLHVEVLEGTAENIWKSEEFDESLRPRQP